MDSPSFVSIVAGTGSISTMTLTRIKWLLRMMIFLKTEKIAVGTVA